MKINRITYLGHSAVFLTADDYRIAIDPWLMNNPLCPADLKTPSEIDLIVLTHGHSDHAEDVLRLAAIFNPKIAATYELAEALIQDGIDPQQVIMLNKGGSHEVDGVRLTLTHAIHSNSYDSTSGRVYAGEAAGVVIEDSNGLVIYHAGDTALFSDMTMIGEQFTPRFAFLPIGDRFTMGPKEAAIAASYIQADITIPIHFATFPELTGTAEEFTQLCDAESLKTIVLEPGETIVTE